MSDSNPPPDFTGLWTVERSDGTRIETQYVNGLANGCYRYWLANGTCLREGSKKNGLWHGTLITRAVDGTVLDVSDFHEGTGTYRIFNSCHQLTDEIPLQHGRPHGAARRWVSGKLVETHHYEAGVCIAKCDV